MKRRIQDYAYMTLVIFGCLQPFVSTEVFSVFGYLFLAAVIFKKRFCIKITGSSAIKFLLFLFVFGFIIGIPKMGTRAYIRDLYYFLNPIIFILIGSNIVDDNWSYKKLLNSIVLISTIISCIDVFTMIYGIVTTGTISNLRTYFDNVIWGNVISIGVIIALWDEDTIFMKFRKTLLVFLIVISFLGLSRTIWIELIVMLVIVTMVGQNKTVGMKRLTGIAIVAVIIIAVSIQYIPDSQLTSIVEKINNSIFEISANDDWTSVTTIQSNWRGYEMYCAKNQFLGSSLLNQIFGGGFGTGIKVGSVSSLVGQSGDYIYVIHNGFYGMLIKEGIVGLTAYIGFYLLLFLKSYKRTIISGSKMDGLAVGTVACMIIYTYLVKGIISDFVQVNALLVIGAWLVQDKCELTNVTNKSEER